jgi:hypothetical protein
MFSSLVQKHGMFTRELEPWCYQASRFCAGDNRVSRHTRGNTQIGSNMSGLWNNPIKTRRRSFSRIMVYAIAGFENHSEIFTTPPSTTSLFLLFRKSYEVSEYTILAGQPSLQTTQHIWRGPGGFVFIGVERGIHGVVASLREYAQKPRHTVLPAPSREVIHHTTQSTRKRRLISLSSFRSSRHDETHKMTSKSWFMVTSYDIYAHYCIQNTFQILSRKLPASAVVRILSCLISVAIGD